MNNCKKIVPYYMFSYPDYETSLDLFKKLTEINETIEIGFPFSDPLADGSVIQAAANEVLRKFNPSLDDYLDFVKKIRNYNNNTTIYCMTYLNPILYYGYDKFLKKSAKSGLNGFIIPDFPPEESIEFLKLCTNYNLKVTFIITPLTLKERIDYISKITTGFIYFVTYTGVTGKKAVMSKENISILNYIKKHYNKDIYIGFGIKNRNDVINMLKYAEKVIVGSALINKFNETNNIDKVVEFMKSLGG